MLFEICIDSAAGALAAQRAGAQRVELCDNLVEGGTTPSLGMMRVTRQAVHIPIMAMIRPRGGDFVYSDEEFQAMQYDIQAAKEEGLYGVVLGLLLPEGRIDLERTRVLVELARPLRVTFHRAFDLSRDPFESLDALLSIGMDRILTGGCAQRAEDGIECLASLVRLAGNRLQILVGGGVRAENIARLMHATGAQEYHFAARSPVNSPMTHRVPGLFMGSSYQPDEYERKETDEARIAAVIAAARPG